MTFQQYINQENPTRQHNVEVQFSDCKAIFKNALPGEHLITLEIFGEELTYLLTDDSPYLYTMDEKGNKESSSCFIWQQPTQLIHI